MDDPFHACNSVRQLNVPFDRASFYYTSCSSTNDMAQAHLFHAAEGTIFITEYQYKGRGQRGTTWTSEAGKNLLFSSCNNFPEENLLTRNSCRNYLIDGVYTERFHQQVSV